MDHLNVASNSRQEDADESAATTDVLQHVEVTVSLVSSLHSPHGQVSAVWNWQEVKTFEIVLYSLEMRWGLLKTVLTGRQFCLHHRQDKTVFSCLVLMVMWTGHYNSLSLMEVKWRCKFWTVCQRTYDLRHNSVHSNSNSRHIVTVCLVACFISIPIYWLSYSCFFIP